MDETFFKSHRGSAHSFIINANNNKLIPPLACKIRAGLLKLLLEVNRVPPRAFSHLPLSLSLVLSLLK